GGGGGGGGGGRGSGWSPGGRGGGAGRGWPGGQEHGPRRRHDDAPRHASTTHQPPPVSGDRGVMTGRWLERNHVPGRQQEPPTAKGGGMPVRNWWCPALPRSPGLPRPRRG